MRKLATVRIASEVFAIKDADAIEAVRVDGWVCVSKKGEFKASDKGVYFEIDSFLPGEDPRFSFLSKQFIKYGVSVGARLRTVRLRNQLSQGLFLPLSLFPELVGKEVGDNVTEELNIQKWEPEIPAQLAGEVIGAFPSFIPVTDQERVQNFTTELDDNKGQEFEASIKLDGTSMTVFRNDKDTDKEGNTVKTLGVCSRNWNLRDTPENTLWLVAKRNNLHEALEVTGKNLAFQGELIGHGIQGNQEKIRGHEFYLFDIFDIDKQEYFSPKERQETVAFLNEKGFNIKHVPILENIILNHTSDELLALADGESLNPEERREGVVFKRLDGQFSFKVISNWYIEKHNNR